jgi:hypothetical protein
MSELTNPDPATDQNTPPDCETCPFRRKAMEDAENKKPPKGQRRLIDEIKDLNIPARAKAELAILCARAKSLGAQVLKFIRRHRALGEAAVLGSIVCYALCFIPWIGGFLGLVALGMSVASGVLRELREDLAALFSMEPVYA